MSAPLFFPPNSLLEQRIKRKFGLRAEKIIFELSRCFGEKEGPSEIGDVLSAMLPNICLSEVFQFEKRILSTLLGRFSGFPNPAHTVFRT